MTVELNVTDLITFGRTIQFLHAVEMCELIYYCCVTCTRAHLAILFLFEHKKTNSH